MQESRAQRLVDRSVERTKRLVERAKDPNELPYGYVTKEPESVRLLRRIINAKL